MNLCRLLLLTVSFFYMSELSAQFKKGDIQLGADAIPELEGGDGFPIKSWQIMPEASYFLFDNASFGLSGFYSSLENNFTDSKQLPSQAFV